MSNIEEKRILQFQKIKNITNSILSFSEVTRSNSKDISNLLYKLYADLENIHDVETIMTKPNTDSVLIPLITLYKTMTTKEKYGYEIIIEPWLKIMEFLLTKTLIKIWMPPKFMIELFTLFSNLIGQSQTSEEVKYLSVLCLSGSLPAKYKEGRYNSFKESIYYSIIKPFQTKDFLPIASAGIVALLSVIQKEQDIKLRIESLKVLSQILFDNINDAELISTFLPGIASKLCATISQKGEKENHQIICECLKVLRELIEITMNDENNNTIIHIESFQDALDNYRNKKNTIENQKRDQLWYKNAKENLFQVMKQILKIQFYPDWRTRLEFIEFSYQLLSKCSYTLNNCVQLLIEMIVLHIDDPYTQVSTNCKLYIQLLKSKSSFEDIIVPILKQELYEWMMKFPKYIISRDEMEKLNVISLIIGFIILLDEQSSSVLSLILDRFSDNWLNALEIDKDYLNILEQKQNQQFIELETIATKPIPIYPIIRFKYIVNDQTTTKLIRLLNIIGKYCDLNNWINHFKRYLSDNDNNDPQAAYIIHSLLFGAFRFELNDEDWIIKEEEMNNDKLKLISIDLLNDMMDILSNSIKLTNKNTRKIISTTNRLDEESGYILTVCFSLQIIGLISSILNEQELQDQFITILYPLLAHLGSTNLYIHTYALITLDSIAIVCGLNNAKELAIQNIDYIINMISQHISVLSDNIRVPFVLKALIHIGGYTCITYLDDTILEIYDALERYNSNEWLCIQLCSVLYEIVETIEKNVTREKLNQIEEAMEEDKEDRNDVSIEIKSFIENNNTIMNEEHATMEEIGKYFLDRQEKGKHDDMTLEKSIMELPIDLPNDNNNEEEEEKDEEKDDKKSLTKQELIVKEIMNRSSHFLTSSSPQLRSQMLILLTHGITILSNHPSELNQFFHIIWISIINRFNDQENYIVFHTAQLIENLSNVSTDYLSRKFIDDLWPKFKMLIRKGIQAVKSNTLSDYSIYSLYHRTQLCLFKTLTKIIYNVPITQPLVKDILEETKYYYKNNQVHQQLSSQCQLLFNALSLQQSDTVWFYEFALNSQQLNSPCKLLDNFIIPEWINML